jgi:hypothetical protein
MCSVRISNGGTDHRLGVTVQWFRVAYEGGYGRCAEKSKGDRQEFVTPNPARERDKKKGLYMIERGRLKVNTLINYYQSR